MSKLKTWLNEPYPRPVRKRWQILLGLFLKGVGEGIEKSQLNQRIRDLEERLEVLEAKNTTRGDLYKASRINNRQGKRP